MLRKGPSKRPDEPLNGGESAPNLDELTDRQKTLFNCYLWAEPATHYKSLIGLT